MRNNKKLLLLSFSLLLVFSFLGWHFCTGTPQWSLYKLSRAIKTHDEEEGERYLDIDRIADSVTEAVIVNMLSKQGYSTSSSWAEQQLTQEMIDSLMPKYKSVFREKLHEAFKDIVENESPKEKPFIGLPDGIFKVIASFNVKRDHKMAFVTYTTPNNEKIGFKMMEKPDRTWKIVSFERQSIIDLMEEIPVNRIKAGALSDIKAGNWVVEAGCCNAGIGTAPCEPTEQYKWLKTLKDKHPKFLAYATFDEADSKYVDAAPKFHLYQVVDNATKDTNKPPLGAYVGPFESKSDADTWINWAGSLTPSQYCYMFISYKIDECGGKWIPAQINETAVKKIKGTIVDVSWGSSGLGTLTLELGSGKNVTFGLDGDKQGVSPEDMGKQCIVEYRDVTIKRENKIITENSEVVSVKISNSAKSYSKPNKLLPRQGITKTTTEDEFKKRLQRIEEEAEQSSRQNGVGPS